MTIRVRLLPSPNFNSKYYDATSVFLYHVTVVLLWQMTTNAMLPDSIRGKLAINLGL